MTGTLSTPPLVMVQGIGTGSIWAPQYKSIASFKNLYVAVSICRNVKFLPASFLVNALSIGKICVHANSEAQKEQTARRRRSQQYCATYNAVKYHQSARRMSEVGGVLSYPLAHLVSFLFISL